MSFARTGMAAAILLGLGVIVRPAEAQDLSLGQQLAQQYCVRCHQLGPASEQNVTLGPSFHVVSADKLELTTKSLMERLNGGHFIEPPRAFSESEARAIGDFISAQR